MVILKVENKYSSLFSQMSIDHPTTITLRSLLNYVQIWPDIVNKFLIAYQNYIQAESVEYKYFNRNYSF
jgi:hypothetical protein